MPASGWINSRTSWKAITERLQHRRAQAVDAIKFVGPSHAIRDEIPFVVTDVELVASSREEILHLFTTIYV